MLVLLLREALLETPRADAYLVAVVDEAVECAEEPAQRVVAIVTLPVCDGALRYDAEV